MSTADHMPTHRTARDTDDAGHVWIHQGRSDFWGPPTPGREGGSSAPCLPAPGRATNQRGGDLMPEECWGWGT